MATAVTPKPTPTPANAGNAANAANAAQPITGSASIAMPDQSGSFHVNAARGAVKHVQVVDVDMVLQMADGSKIVLAGGAMGAMDEKSKIVFNDTSQDTGRMLDLVGKIPLQNHDQSLILNSDPNKSNNSDGGAQDNHFNTNNNSAQVNTAATSLLAKIIQDNAGSLTSNGMANLSLPTIAIPPAPPVTTGADALIKQISEQLPERSGSVLTPIVVGPQTPAMTLNLVNLATVTQVGSTLFGSGGTSASSSDGSNVVQFAAQVLNAGNDVHTIYATSTTTQSDFVKIFQLNVTGDGTVKTITITGVPSNLTILNAVNQGGGTYLITPNAGDKSFALQVQYSTTAADPTQPIEPTSTINFDVAVLTTDGLTHLTDSRIVVIKDASSSGDLSYLDPATGKSVWVLPAQGVPHEIHAGDGGVTIYGSNANDSLYGGAGADTIIGGSGNTYFEGGAGADVLTGGTQGVNTAGYKNSSAGVTINLITGLGSGGDAQGDVLHNIQNLIGSAYNDTFVGNDKVNRLDGGGDGVSDSNTVSYAGSTAGVTVNLITGTGSGGYAEGDTYVRIQNVTGSAYNDLFIANGQTNHFDGGSGGSDTVSYASSPAASDGTGVTVNLSTGVGAGGSAAGDTYVHIQNVIGSVGNDTFVANIDANSFDGGSGGVDTVSYANSATGVTVNFVSGRGTGGDAEGDTYNRIQNVIGSTHDDVFLAGPDSRKFDGGGGSDTVNYGGSNAAVTVDLISMTGTGGYANNNTYVNIQNAVGSSYGDLFISNALANHFDGGAGGSDTVSYATSPVSAGNVGVTVDLYNGTASGGYATGDTLAHIQNVIGSAGDDLFIASADANSFEGGLGSNTVSYVNATDSVTVDLFNGTTTGGSVYAIGDTYSNIQNVIGSAADDIFVANAAVNKFDGGASSTTSHNRVSYANSTTAETIDLLNGVGSGTMAAGDTYVNIQDATGGSGDDTFVASNVSNRFDGGGGSNRVNYATSTGAVTIDLVGNTGDGGYATGDLYSRIQNVTGSAYNDTFIASSEANDFNGGSGGSDTVSYARANDGIGVTVNLVLGNGSNGYAAGDTYTHIQNVIGSSYNDLFYASSDSNSFAGTGGSDTVSYFYSTAGVTVDLVTGNGTGGFAAGDTYTGIQNVIGSASDDLFIASAVTNAFDGGLSTSTSHNRVSYVNSTTAETVNLFTGVGTGGLGSFANGDTYVNIQDVTGGSGDDIFVASLAANSFDGGASTAASHNRVSYANSSVSETVNLFTGQGSGGAGSLANGDTYVNIQDVTGGTADDLFIASAAANKFDGGTSTATSHNRVSYVNSAVAETVDLVLGTGSGGAGSLANGDTYVNIQDVTGGSGDDTFVASTAANNFDGGSSTLTSHNRVSYANSTVSETVNLVTNLGSGGAGSYAAGDTYANIQDVTGGSGDDTFVASTAANNFDGGSSTTSSHNLVSYVNSGVSETVNLFTGQGSGGAGSYAAGDTYVNIQDVTGGSADDTFVASAAANKFDGGASTASSHNRVSYVNSTAAETVNLVLGTGTGTLAQGDTYVNIQDVTGGSGDDTFVASTAANNFDGGSSTTTSHNRVSYVNSTVSETVNLFTGQGTGGVGSYAAGDTYVNIQDVTGGSADDLFIASTAANNFDGGTSTVSSHNQVSYVNSAVAETVNLFTGQGSGGAGSLANGDTYINIQDVTGGSADDTFVASAAANKFDGGASTASSHNRVSYVNSTAVETVDLVLGTGTGTLAQGDTYVNIQDVTGGSGDDTFVASTAANNFDGGSSTTSSHNRVSYANSTVSETVNLVTGQGTGGVGSYAAGDTYVNIQDVTGGSADDLFIASTAANRFDGGASTAASHNRVSYVNSTAAETIDLVLGTGTGTFAQNDTFINIQDVTGGSGDDTFVASTAANNFDGGSSTTTSHNRVSYVNSAVSETVNLFTGQGSGGAGSYAAGDTYVNIQDVTGGSADDLFIASTAANKFDGGTSTATSHNQVSYVNSAVAETVNLFTGQGSGGAGSLANGDTYANIQDVTGGSGDDTFVASAASNRFDGGVSTTTSHNRVSYVNSTAAETVDLVLGTGTGTLAQGDTYANIQDVTGGSGDDTFVASLAANNFDGGTSTATSHNRVSYANSTVSETVNLVTGQGTGGVGSYAAGDTYANIQDVTGGSADDLFIASTAANKFDGGSSTAASHNRVSYVNSTAAETIDLVLGTGTGTFAQGDTFVNIQDVTGGSGDDTFVASLAANNFDGGSITATSHNRVSYANSAVSETVNLFTGQGTGGAGSYAAGDTYVNIQDVTGGSADDLFIASAAANKFDGGASTAASHNRVSYANSTVAETINLFTGQGSGGAGSLANGDTYANIQDVTGGSGDDTFIANAAANNFDGGAGSDTVSFAASTVSVNVNLSSGAAGVGGFADGDTFTNIENVIGGSAADILTAAASGRTVLTGGGGGDTLAGTAANHANTYASYSTSGSGVTVDLNFTDGTGTSGGDAAGDKLSLIDNLIGSASNDTFVANNVANSFDGGAGQDTVSYFRSDAGVTVSLASGTAGSGGYATGDTYANMENIIGSNFADVLTGANAGVTVLTGLGGGDTLAGTAANHANTYASYAGSASGVTVDLNFTDGTGTSGGDAAGDKLSLIDNLIGSSFSDTFVSNNIANSFDGGAGGVDTVSYLASNAAVIVDLSNTTGAGTSGGYAAGDKFTGISNLIGSNFDDTFFASSVANAFNGSGHGANGDTVNYARSGTTAVTVDLYHGTGANGYAAGDTYTNIQNVSGSAGNDTFYGSADNNTFTGGGGVDTVSYLYAGSVSASGTIIANLATGLGTGGDASGDKYVNIANLEGSATVDSQLTGDANANILTVQGLHTTNTLSGGGAGSGTDIFNVQEGGSNSVTVGSGANTVNVSAGSHSSAGAQSDMVNKETGVSNIASISGGAGITTLHFDDLGSSITLANFSNKVTGITTLDMTSGTGTNIVITATDVINMGIASGATSHILTVKMSGSESLQIAANGSDHYVYFPGTTDYAFYNASNQEIARIHLSS